MRVGGHLQVTVTYKGGSVTERFGLRAFGVDKHSARLCVMWRLPPLLRLAAVHR